MNPRKILITGSNGFVGKNLKVRISEIPGWDYSEFSRENSASELSFLIKEADVVIHLAGENRPQDIQQFDKVNAQLTTVLCKALLSEGRKIPLIYTSSAQVLIANPYGQSKLAGESAVKEYAAEGNPAIIYRLPNVFGKWCKPNYNSVVATFCHNIANDMPIQINDGTARLNLVYIDDVITSFLSELTTTAPGLKYAEVVPIYSTTVADLSEQIYAFKNCRENLMIENVGTGFVKALYSTYISYLPSGKFSYPVPTYIDERGIFVEMLKTKDSGQFSFFTAYPGVTRGNHYHHSKTEKFLVIKGKARFGFRHLITGEKYTIETSGDKAEIVETIPGYAHDITNISSEEMVVMIWANEVFDREKPDTIAAAV